MPLEMRTLPYNENKRVITMCIRNKLELSNQQQLKCGSIAWN